MSGRGGGGSDSCIYYWSVSLYSPAWSILTPPILSLCLCLYFIILYPLLPSRVPLYTYLLLGPHYYVCHLSSTFLSLLTLLLFTHHLHNPPSPLLTPHGSLLPHPSCCPHLSHPHPTCHPSPLFSHLSHLHTKVPQVVHVFVQVCEVGEVQLLLLCRQEELACFPHRGDLLGFLVTA